MPGHYNRPPKGENPFWMHRDLAHLSQSFVEYGEAISTSSASQDRPTQLVTAPVAPRSSPPPAVEPITPTSKPHSEISTMAILANQGLPRQSDENSPNSTGTNQPGSASSAANMAASTPQSASLPLLPAPSTTIDEALINVASKRFKIDTVCAALQHDCSVKGLADYLGSYSVEYVKGQMNTKLAGRCTPIFYAVDHAIEHDSLRSIELLLKYGASPNAYLTSIGQPCQVPVLAYAIVRGADKLKNTLSIVKLLLSAGANPDIDFVSSDGNRMSSSIDWSVRYNNATNISHAYFLRRAENGGVFPTGSKKQLAVLYGLWNLMTIDNYLVGQDHALKLVKDSVFAHIATNSQHPLVMAFTGPSGHGKTEMASQMGKLLSLEITVVDCAHMRHDTDLFGSRNGYKRSEEGSQLNNFLARHEGERAVVFLDEFDKTPQEIRDSLLLICDSGIYHDRRNNEPVDCSKILWVLATNLGDLEVKAFSEKKIKMGSADSKTEMPIETLQAEITAKFRDQFGAPFTGRIDVVVPFLPFSTTEQAIVAHGLLMQLTDEFRLPIDCRPSVKRYLGHSFLDLGDGVGITKYIAANCYNADLGARSLKRGIEELKRKFVMAFCEAHPMEVTEDMNRQPVKHFRVQVRQKMDNKQDLVVFYQGLTKVYSKSAVQKASGGAGMQYDALRSDYSSSSSDDSDRSLYGRS